MADIGTKEAAKKWGVSQVTVQKWCREGKIKGATQDKKVALGTYQKMQNHQTWKDNKMKKIISLLLATILALSSLFTLASCNSKENSKENSKTYLTLSNYEQYLEVSAKYYGEDGDWNSIGKDYYYSKIISSASVSSTSSLAKFYDCSISIKITGKYKYGSDTRNTSETLVINLSLGGTGSAKKNTVTSYSNHYYNIQGIGYEVVSVSGYVIVN